MAREWEEGLSAIKEGACKHMCACAVLLALACTERGGGRFIEAEGFLYQRGYDLLSGFYFK